MSSKLLIGVYYRQHRSAMLAHLETAAEYRQDVLTFAGAGLVGALHDLLVTAQPLGARRLEIVTNAEDLVKVFTRPNKVTPIRLALPDRTGPKGLISLSPRPRYGPTPSGNALQWTLARDLCRFESWRMVYAKHLPKTEALWLANFAT